MSLLRKVVTIGAILLLVGCSEDEINWTDLDGNWYGTMQDASANDPASENAHTYAFTITGKSISNVSIDGGSSSLTASIIKLSDVLYDTTFSDGTNAIIMREASGNHIGMFRDGLPLSHIQMATLEKNGAAPVVSWVVDDFAGTWIGPIINQLDLGEQYHSFPADVTTTCNTFGCATFVGALGGIFSSTGDTSALASYGTSDSAVSGSTLFTTGPAARIMSSDKTFFTAYSCQQSTTNDHIVKEINGGQYFDCWIFAGTKQ